MTSPVWKLPLVDVKSTPRTRMAARLYATGACKTKRAASAAAGLHPNYLAMLTNERNGSEAVRRIVQDVDAMLENEAIEESVIIRKLGRNALSVLSGLMSNPNDHIKLKAAIDLADRSPYTAKTQKVLLESLSLTGQDVKELAAAMTESHKQSARFADVTTKGLVEVQDLPVRELPPGEPSA